MRFIFLIALLLVINLFSCTHRIYSVDPVGGRYVLLTDPNTGKEARCFVSRIYDDRIECSAYPSVNGITYLCEKSISVKKPNTTYSITDCNIFNF